MRGPTVAAHSTLLENPYSLVVRKDSDVEIYCLALLKPFYLDDRRAVIAIDLNFGAAAWDRVPLQEVDNPLLHANTC
jgi:hypothetical protein